jgi:hypothetical protein
LIVTRPTGNVTHPEGKHRAECGRPNCPWTFESERDGEAAHALMEHDEREHS